MIHYFTLFCYCIQLPEDLGPLGDPLRKRKRVLPPVWDRLTAGVVPSSTALVASLKDEDDGEGANTAARQAGSNRGTPSPVLPPLSNKQGARGQQKLKQQGRSKAAAGGATAVTGASMPGGGREQTEQPGMTKGPAGWYS
jgi:hypothetical protein